MKRRAVILASAASAAAILAGWELGALNAVTMPVAQDNPTAVGGFGSNGSGSGGSGSSGSGSAGATAGRSTGSSSQASASSAVDGTFTGTTVSTRFGNVQVQVTISGGALTDVTALHLTDHDGRSVSISNRAAPILKDEVLQAQSASVSMVSGATYTSAAYLQSLQAALDQAGF